MKKRILVAVICVPLLLALILCLPPIGFTVLLMALCAIGAWELMHPTGLVSNRWMLGCAMVMAALVPLWSYFGSEFLPMLAGLTVFSLCIFGGMLKFHATVTAQGMCSTFFAGVIMPYFFSALVRLLVQEDGRFLILVPLLIAFIADGGAYFAGRAFGKHKLAPVVSPKKTVEGLVGGYLCAIAGMMVYCLIVNKCFDRSVSYVSGLVCAAVGASVSVVGDLVFSVIKRQTGIKDYGKLLPGHGGVMDRFDSMITTAPAVEVIVLLLPLLG